MTKRNDLLAEARSRRDITARAVAALVDMPESRIYKLEAGASVSEGTLRKYYDAKLITRAEYLACFLGKAAA